MAVVNACTRDGQGGSPTAVVIDDATLTDDDRHAIARRTHLRHDRHPPSRRRRSLV
jgi:predicted PhzF superfamily epimerase YddE/YHI9